MSGALMGATIGSIVPGLGTAVGGTIGGILGGAYGLYKGFKGENKEIGGDMSAGMTYLTGERGPELVTPHHASTVTSNANLTNALNFEPLESKMTSMVTELNAANKKLTNMVDGVNMLVGVNSKTMRSTDGILRATKTTSGQVLHT